MRAPIVVNSALQGVSLACAEHCCELTASLKIAPPNRELVKLLAACATRCIACARGCEVGTCLPETIVQCVDACQAVVDRLESLGRVEFENGELHSPEKCISACEACIEASHM
jgi:hypothetical protein